MTQIIELENYYNTRLVHVSGYFDPSHWDIAPHSHEHCEIFVHIKGEFDIFVEQNTYSQKDNEIRFYRPGELHCGKAYNSQMMEWYQISLSRRFLAENPLLCKFLYQESIGNIFVSRETELLQQLLKELFEKESGPLLKYYAQSTVIRLLCILNEEENNLSASIYKNKNVQQLLAIINREFKSISNVDDLCSITHYSRSYINKIFKDHVNSTPYKFIIGKKLNEAKKSLGNGRTVTEACEDAGFNNYNNFITLFHKTFKMTPFEYKRLHMDN